MKDSKIRALVIIPAKTDSKRLKNKNYPNTGIKDRGFMDSIYFHEPLGLLIELASYKLDPPFGYTHGQIPEKAHKLRIKRGAQSIEDTDVASAIKSLVWKNNSI